ncbi:MAG TPA: NAD(P)-dependent oxidoreductase [Tepidisphaeraceae bacterium]|jgi:nucleoside-diphosphate-sugar epimerase|nr:NAD(P)-dependent oxidoreductase [Tepidisphaeraceae bacterium]
MSNGLRVAVTGGSGQIGTSVCRELIARGHQVLNLDRRGPRHPVEGARFVYVDLRQRELIQPILETVDAVCHLGEIPNPGAPISQDELFYTNTRIGSVVLQTVADLKLRHVVYTSSCQVYGTWGWPNLAPKFLPMDETHPTQPQNHYALSKVANEMYAQWVSAQFGLSVSIFRLPMVFRRFHESWAMHIDRPATEMPNELGTYLHATDAATAYAQAIERALPGCETYHLVADDLLINEPLSDLLRRFRPDWPTVPTDWPAFRSPVLTTKAKEKLDWVPKFDFREEFRKILAKEPLSNP